MLAGGTSEPSQGFWAYLGPPWGHPWGSGLVPRSMGGQQKNTNFHFFSTFKLTKTSILPNCQVSNGNFLFVENYTNFNISGLLKARYEKIVYWLCRFSILLGFIMSKNLKGLWFIFWYKFRTQSLLFFWHIKTQEDRESTESINYLLRSGL